MTLSSLWSRSPEIPLACAPGSAKPTPHRAATARERLSPQAVSRVTHVVALILCITVPASVFAAEKGNSYNIKYDGGSLQDVKAGMDMKLFIDADKVRLERNKKEVVVIPAASVTEISYGQDVHRRVGTAIGLAVVSLGVGALMALSKSKKHYIGITWDDSGKKGGIAVQADKSDYRGLLAGLEGITGKKAVDSDALTVKN